MNLIIREARTSDLDRLMAIEKETFPPEEAAERGTFEYRILNFREWFLVAETDGLLVGLINGRTTKMNAIEDELYEPNEVISGEYFALLCVETDPLWQRNGIASTLINYVINQAKNDGLKGIILACKDVLIPYYKKLGFELVGVSESIHGGAVWYDMQMLF